MHHRSFLTLSEFSFLFLKSQFPGHQNFNFFFFSAFAITEIGEGFGSISFHICSILGSVSAFQL